MSVLMGSCAGPGGGAGPAGEEPAPLPVTTAVATMRERSETFEVGGVLQGRAHATIASRLIASVTSVGVRAGDRVRAGQVLVVLDDQDLAARAAEARAGETASSRRLDAARSEQAAAEAAAVLARATYRRIADLYEQRSATAQEHDEARAAVQAADARLAAVEAGVAEAEAGVAGAQAGRTAAEAGAGFARITAPFDGVITERTVEPGQMVTPGMPLIRLEDTSGLELEVHVDESRAAWVEPGATVPVMVGRADGPMEQPGRVTEISRAVEADMRAVLVTIALTEAGDLRPGMFGRARLPGPSERVLSMPAAALVRRGQLTSAFVVGDGRARLRLVRVGRQTDGQVDVLAGLTAGERVVVDPPAELRDGAWVRDSAEEAS